MKLHTSVLALASLLGISAHAAPFAAVGDNAELFLTADVSMEVDDNIFLRRSGLEINDVIWKVTPGVDFKFGKDALTSGNVFYTHSFHRYADTTRQNTDLPSIGINSLYSNGKSKFDFGASYRKSASNEASAPGAILEKNITSGRAIGEFGFSEKTSFGGGVRYEAEELPAGGVYRDSDKWTVPLDLYFEFSPKLQASVGYQYRNTDLSGNAVDFKDHFFSVGARGEFTPKLTGQVRVGYVTRDFSNNRDESDIGAGVDLTFAASDKTSVTIGASSDFETTPTGENNQVKSLNLGLNSRIDEQWSWNIDGSLRSMDYATRTDDMVSLGGGFSYTYSEALRFAARFVHKSQSSPLASAEFDNNVFSLSANLRY
jgi:polysaccharide biosynthesis protein VpsM